jgi:hypothetical protein
MIVRFCVAVFLLLLAASEASAAKRVALVIANGDYVNLPKLGKVLNDARPLRETLASGIGFDVIYGENLGRREMNKKIAELDVQVKRGDIVFIYFAGHGVSLSGDNYMLPVDMQQLEPGEEKFVISDSFGAGALVRKLQSKGANATFMVLDANRKNPFNQAIGPETGLEKFDVAQGAFVMYAAGVGQASLDALSDTDQNPNSVFARSFIPALKTPGLSQIDLGKKMQDEVSAAASAAGLEQKPAYFDQMRELITLNSDTGEVITESKGVTDDQSLILEEWKVVKGSKNRAALEGFKAKYGKDPVWGPLADEELSKLDGKSKQPSKTTEEPAEFTEDAENLPLYRDLQTELQRIGCYSGNADGVWGASSQRALAKFGRYKGAPVEANVNALEALLDTDEVVCEDGNVAERDEPEAAEEPAEKAEEPKVVPRPKVVTTTRPREEVVEKRREVTRAKPRVKRTARVKKRAARPRSSVACWVCFTYTYDTERICVPRRVGNPVMRIPRLTRCARG